tara:strand:+ start:2817 stop:3932 length:1116 start_codon:yes stop_codon:yes gene_type:complete
MKVLINSSHQRFGGAVQVAISFLNECKHFTEHEYIVCMGPGISKIIDVNAFPSNFTFYPFDFGAVNLFNAFHINRELRKVEKKEQPDAVVSHTGPSYFHSRAPQLIGYNLPVFIYPESPYVQVMSLKTKIKIHCKKLIQHWFLHRDAAALSVQTNDVNERISKVFKSIPVHTVTNNASHYFNEPKPFTKKLPEILPGEFRFLTLTSYYPHKDLEIIPRIAGILEDRGIHHIKFILTVKQEDFKSKLESHPNVINIGPVPINEAPSLYQECNAMFLPSLAECFSASYAEAMRSNKPIITTEMGFSKSVCGKAALYYEPVNALQAAEAIIQLIQDNSLQETLIKNGQEQLKNFDSPKERAAKYLEICAELRAS